MFVKKEAQIRATCGIGIYTRDMYAQENNYMSQIIRLLIEMSLV